VATDLEADQWQWSSSRTFDGDEHLPGSGTVSTLLAPTSTSVVDDLRGARLDRATQTPGTHAGNAQHGRTLGPSNVVGVGGLSTNVSGKFTDDFQHGTIWNIFLVLKVLFLYY